MKKRVSEFFAFARARHSIHLRRFVAREAEPWTREPILGHYRFTNVFRELDKTTAWFRQHVRDPLRDRPEVLLATVVFRLLNRITTGEAIFCQTIIPPKGWKWDNGKSPTAFDLFLKNGDVRHLGRAVRQFCGKGPYVTGAYIISSPSGYKKLDGVLKIIEDFNEKSDWRDCAAALLEKREGTLQGVWNFLKEQPFFGPFHSYEIVTDLRHTALLRDAPDVMTWCNVGPGARRGINRVMGRDKRDHSVSTEQMLAEMRELLDASQYSENWPQHKRGGGLTHRNDEVFLAKGVPFHEQWPQWEMREVEHTLCEFDKYMRVKLKELTKKGTLATPRGVFR